jgi:PAS domain S-box-containing protein
MNYIFRSILLFSLLCAGVSLAKPTKTIRVGIDSMMPFNFINEDGEASGLTPDLLREIVRDQDEWDVEFVPTTWSEGSKKLQNETLDLMVSVAYSPARARVMEFNRTPIVEIWGQVFIPRDATMTHISELQGKKIGVMSKDLSGEHFVNLSERFNIDCTITTYAEYDEVFAAIKSGEIDAGIAPNHHGLRLANQYNLTGSPIQFSPVSLFFAAKKGKQQEFLAEIDFRMGQWKHDQNSYYAQRLDYWMNGKKAASRWPWILVCAISATALLLFTGNRWLKHQISKRTKELTESKRRFELAMQASKDGLWDWNILTNEVYYSPSYFAMLGYPADKAVHDFSFWETHVHPDDIASILVVVTKCVEKGDDTFSAEFRMRTKDGDWRWILSRGMITSRDENRRAIRIIGTHTDITEQKEIEKQMVDLARFPEENTNPVLRISTDGQLLYANKSATIFSTVLGARPSEPVNEEWRARIQQALTTQQPFETEVSVGAQTFAATIAPIAEQNYVNIYARDITVRKQMHQRLELTQFSLDNASVAAVWVNQDASIAYLNKAMSHMLGYSHKELLTLRLINLIPNYTDEAWAEHWAELEEQRLIILPSLARTREGVVLPIEIQANFLEFQGEKYNCAFVRDISKELASKQRKEFRLLLGEWTAECSFDELLTRSLNEIEKITGSTCGFCHFVEENQHYTATQTATTFTDHAGSDPAQARAWTPCLETARPVIHNDYQENRHKPELPEGHIPMTRDLTVPVIQNKNVVAVLGVGNKPSPYTQNDIEMVSQLAEFTWNALQHKLDEDAKKASESRYRILFENMPAGFALHDIIRDESGTPIDYRFVNLNPAYEKLIGQSSTEVVGHALKDILPATEACWIDLFNLVATTGESAVLEAYWQDLQKYCAVRAFRPAPNRLAITCSDISERMRMHDALEKRIIALTRPLEGDADIELEELFDLKQLQRIQDEFASATGVASIITHIDGTPITQPSHFTDLCMNIIRGTKKGCANCFKSDSALGRCHPDGPIIQPCLSGGLWDAGASITVGGRHIANWLIGQVRDETQTEEHMRAYAREIGADEAQLIAAFNRVPAMKREHFDEIAQALFTLANQLSTSAYQNVQQARFISEQKKAERELRESEERFKSLHNASFGGIAIHDNGIIMECNRGLAIVSGYSEKELIGMDGLLLIAESERAHVRAQVQNGTEKEYETIGLRKNGEEFPLKLNGRNVHYKGHQARTTEFRDITESKKAERELSESQKYLEAMWSAMDVGIVLIDEKTHKILRANPAILKMSGHSSVDKLINNPCHKLLCPTQIGNCPVSDLGEEVHCAERVLIHADGHLVDIEKTISKITLNGREVLLETMTDISARKKTETELRRLSTAIEQSPEAVVIADPAGTIQYVNPAFETITGYTRAEAIGKNPRILKSGEHHADFYTDLWKTIRSGQTWEGRFINRHKNGSLYTEEASISPVCDANNGITGFVAIKRDITAELAREEQFRHSQKMESIGQLAGGIAHDLNNLLTPILGYSSMLQETATANSFEETALAQIEKAGKRARDLVRQLLTFSRKQLISIKIIDLNHVFADFKDLLLHTIRNNINLCFEPYSQPLLVRADQGQFEQILMNLCVNAQDAMPNEGKLHLSLHPITLTEENKQEYQAADSGDYALLRVSDTGSGIPPEILPKIFDPFFTTKGIGEGTGLGLSTIFGIVKQHNGGIRVLSKKDKGTTFEIVLPRANPDSAK